MRERGLFARRIETMSEIEVRILLAAHGIDFDKLQKAMWERIVQTLWPK